MHPFFPNVKRQHHPFRCLTLNLTTSLRQKWSTAMSDGFHFCNALHIGLPGFYYHLILTRAKPSCLISPGPQSSLNSVLSSSLPPGAQFWSGYCPIWEVPMFSLPRNDLIILNLQWDFASSEVFSPLQISTRPKCQLSRLSLNVTSSGMPSFKLLSSPLGVTNVLEGMH